MAAPAVGIESTDLEALLKDLAAGQRQFKGELRKAHKDIAVDIGNRVASRAASSFGTRSVANAWKGTGTNAGARFYLSTPKDGPRARAIAAFMGARPLTRTGWNAHDYPAKGVRGKGRRRLSGARPQFRTWVGNNWVVGLPGEGPYVWRDVAPQMTDEISDRYAKAYTDAIGNLRGTT